MTASTIALTELAEKGADVDVLRQMVQFMAQRLMEIEACIKGSSTRSVDDLVKAIGMSGVSKSPVSRLCGELDEQVGAFLNRTLEGDWPYLWIDATYVTLGSGLAPAIAMGRPEPFTSAWICHATAPTLR